MAIKEKNAKCIVIFKEGKILSIIMRGGLQSRLKKYVTKERQKKRNSNKETKNPIKEKNKQTKNNSTFYHLFLYFVSSNPGMKH